MNSDLFSINNTQVEIMLDNTLTNFDKEVLTRCYLPIIKQNSLNILLYLYSIIPSNERETYLTHKQILVNLGINEIDFINNRKKLEALGLIEVYIKEQLYIYVLKEVLTPFEFFSNIELVQILTGIIGKEEVEKIKYDLLLRKLDPSNFINITSSFDDVYQVSFGDSIYQYNGFGVDTTNNGIKIKKEQFNIDHYRLLLEAKTNMINKEYLSNVSFLDKITRLAFLFGLSVDEMINVTILSCDSNKEVIDKDLIYQAKRCYDGHNNPINVKEKTCPNNLSDEKLDKTVKVLETLSPSEIVQGKYKTNLTSSEIEMFNTLLEKTGVNIGVLNVCIIDVMSRLDGEIPNITYFEKILNTWIRKNIVSTADALKYIENNTNNNPKANNKYSKNKRVVPIPESIKNRDNNISNINNNNNKSNNDEDTSDILGDLFK